MARLGDVSFFLVDEGHNYESDITDHPVEFEQNIADHVKNRPVVFDITGKVTGDDAASVHLSLTKIWRSRQPVIYVGRGRIDNVVVGSLSTTRDNTNKHGFNFTLRVKQVRRAKPSTINLLAPSVRSQVKEVSNAGRVQAS